MRETAINPIVRNKNNSNNDNLEHQQQQQTAPKDTDGCQVGAI